MIHRWPIGVWTRFWFEPGPASRLGLSRAIFCAAAFLFYLPHDFTEWATAAPVFWMPIPLFEALHLRAASPATLLVVQTVWKASLGMSALGLWTRLSTAVAAALGTYLLGLPHNFGATQHFDAIVVFALFILAFSRAGDARSLDAVIRARRHGAPTRPLAGPEYTWPIRAMWVMTALVFFGAGTSKLRHSGLEWALSDNLRLLLMRGYYHVSDGDPLTDWGLTIAKYSWLSRAFALSALAIETTYIVALFSRRARPFIGASGLLLLFGIRVLMGPTFESFVMCGLLFVPWHHVEAGVARWVAERPVVTRRSVAFGASIVLLAALLAAGVLASQPPAARWIPAWSTSQQVLGTTTITNRTMRMIGRLTAGGDAVRIRIDNTFGTTPVTIGSAYVGVPLVTRSGESSSQGAALVPGSNQQVLFGGSAAVVVPPGGSVASDPVPMKVVARQDLAVSFYVPDTDVRPSQHTNAQVRSYMSANGAGDVAADETRSPYTTSTSSTFWLKAIDVLSTSAKGAVVAFGDSITDGTCSTFGGHDRWEDWLALRFDSLAATGDVKAVVNEGIGGNTVTEVGGNTMTAGIKRLDRDVLSHEGATDVILFMGTNDIKYGVTAAKIIAGMQDIVTRVRARGLRIFGVTILPRQSSDWTAAKEQVRQQVNQWIRGETAFHGIIDFDTLLREPTNTSTIGAFVNCDNIHPNPLGYYQMGKAVDLTMVAQ